MSRETRCRSVLLNRIDVVGLAGVLGDSSVLGRWNHTGVGGILIGIEGRLLTILHRKVGP